jgi:hypothetical protein
MSGFLSLTTSKSGAVQPQIYKQIGAQIWLLGIAVMLVYSIVSVIILNKRLKNARQIELSIYEASNLKTPFVLGIFKPRIFIPSELETEEKGYIIQHEQIHIRRLDHIIKPIAFLILSIHWFNPLVWIAFVLMSTDMELSCDERVIKEMGSEIKRDYSASLLSLASEKHILNGSPLAFGEGNVKGRIKNVLNYKKTASWIVAVVVIAVAAVSVGLLVNPKSDIYTQKAMHKIVEEAYPEPYIAEYAGEQKVYDNVPFYVFKIRNPLISVAPGDEELQIFETIGVIPQTGAFLTYDTAKGKWYAPSGLLKTAGALALTFKTTDTDLIGIGKIAFSYYIHALTSEDTPNNERIVNCNLNDISTIDGNIDEFLVSFDYDFTTDNNEYVNSDIGVKGKGTWSNVYMEFIIGKIGKNTYRVIDIGTGDGR